MLIKLNFTKVIKNIIIIWIFPVLISLGLFLLLQPVFAQVVEGTDVTLSDYLKGSNVEVGLEEVDGYTQVYYIFNGEKVFITSGSVNSNMQVTDGNLVVFRKSIPGGDQIFSYNLLTKQSVQITSSGNNTNPKIDGDNIVWEGLAMDNSTGVSNWQIFLFDGTKVKQISDEGVSVNADINDDYIIYASKDITGTWKSIVYSLDKKDSREVTVGVSSKHPKVKNGKIFLGLQGEEKEFTLTADDLFVLDLSPISATSSAENQTGLLKPEVVTTEEIAQEIEATTSASPISPE